MRTINGIKNQIHKIIKSLRFFKKSFLPERFRKLIISHKTATTHHIIINQVALESVRITEEVSTLNFLTSHIAIIHSHRLVIEENHNQTSSNPNRTKSTNAVILASAANQKNNHAIKIYLNKSFFHRFSFHVWDLRRRMCLTKNENTKMGYSCRGSTLG